MTRYSWGHVIAQFGNWNQCPGENLDSVPVSEGRHLPLSRQAVGIFVCPQFAPVPRGFL